MIATKFFKNHNGSCPYLPGKNWTTSTFYNQSISAKDYEALISRGFRRTGFFYYRNSCSNCAQCIPLRVPTEEFTPSSSQKRVWRKNADVKIKFINKLQYSLELYELYQEYLKARYNQKVSDPLEFVDSLLTGPSYLKIVKYYLKDKLIAASWIDVLPTGISSIYSAYSLQFEARSLGVYTALFEIHLAQKLKRPWYYLGYWVKSGANMDYKSKYRPCQILKDTTWEYLK